MVDELLFNWFLTALIQSELKVILSLTVDWSPPAAWRLFCAVCKLFLSLLTTLCWLSTLLCALLTSCWAWSTFCWASLTRFCKSWILSELWYSDWFKVVDDSGAWLLFTTKVCWLLSTGLVLSSALALVVASAIPTKENRVAVTHNFPALYNFLCSFIK